MQVMWTLTTAVTYKKCFRLHADSHHAFVLWRCYCLLPRVPSARGGFAPSQPPQGEPAGRRLPPLVLDVGLSVRRSLRLGCAGHDDSQGYHGISLEGQSGGCLRTHLATRTLLCRSHTVKTKHAFRKTHGRRNVACRYLQCQWLWV